MLRRYSDKDILFFLAVLALIFGSNITAQAQLGIAPIQPNDIGDAMNCHVGGQITQLKPDKSLIKATRSFAPDNVEMQKLLDEVSRHIPKLYINIYMVPVTDNINVRICPSDNGRNYIAFSPIWLQKIYDETGNKWALYAIIAHEIGHYVRGHDRTSVGSDPDVEKEADEYAGETLAKMKAPLPDAQAAFHSRLMASVESHTHPPIAERLAAVARGWHRVARMRPGPEGATIAPTQSGRPPYRQAVGTPCVRSPDGKHYRC